MSSFLADLELCNTVRKTGSVRQSPPKRTAHYSPLLHCCILYLGLYMIREQNLTLMRAYDSFFISHCSSLIYGEADSSSLGSLRGYNLFAICAHCVRSAAADYQMSPVPKPTMTGFLYAGIALAGVHALSLNVDCSNYVANGQITAQERNLRDYAFWSIHIVDTLRAIPHGRQPILQDVDDIPLPQIDPVMDNVAWKPFQNPAQSPEAYFARAAPDYSRSMQSTTFHWLARLALITRSMMKTL